jgi:hypothetical protein
MSVAFSCTILVKKGQPPRLLDQLRDLANKRFCKLEPAERYASWALRYILFHSKRHPRELAASEVERFLEHGAKSEKDPLGCL